MMMYIHAQRFDWELNNVDQNSRFWISLLLMNYLEMGHTCKQARKHKIESTDKQIISHVFKMNKS